MAILSIVGGETLLGREVRDQGRDLAARHSMQMIGAGDEAETTLTGIAGEVTVMTPLDRTRLITSDLVICAGDPASTRKCYEMVQLTGPPLIDLTSTLEDLPQARIRSALSERSTTRTEQAPSAKSGDRAVQIVAHPAASVAAALLARVHASFPVAHSVIQIFEPASERGQAGIHELQQQVTGLLGFRPLEKKVFDAQAGFNLLARYGEDAPVKLEDVELRIERHLATLLGGSAPLPSLRLIQAPVFHGHSFSFRIEFASRPGPDQLAAALASAQIEVRGPGVEPPTNVGVAGQSGITAGVIEPDRNHPRAMWLWAVADNYRVLADDGIAVARELLEALP